MEEGIWIIMAIIAVSGRFWIGEEKLKSLGDHVEA
jgi:hypothetical protein